MRSVDAIVSAIPRPSGGVESPSSDAMESETTKYVSIYLCLETLTGNGRCIKITDKHPKSVDLPIEGPIGVVLGHLRGPLCGGADFDFIIQKSPCYNLN